MIIAAILVLGLHFSPSESQKSPDQLTALCGGSLDILPKSLPLAFEDETYVEMAFGGCEYHLPPARVHCSALAMDP